MIEKAVLYIKEQFDHGSINTFSYNYEGQRMTERMGWKYIDTERLFFSGAPKLREKDEYSYIYIGYLLDKQGRVINWIKVFPEVAGNEELKISEGMLIYDVDGYLKQVTRLDGCDAGDLINTLTWKNSNLIRADENGDFSTLEYGIQLNNLDINMDLNWAFLSTEWLDNAVFEGEKRFKLFANLGNRSKHYIIKEQGHSQYDEGYFSRLYEFDEHNRPSKISVMHVTEKGTKLKKVATISYTKN
ncbi:hypothetical protein [Bacteroides reticulotermitis]|uniref:hypothetical protein n=1 Tax=Bacteroides reticulotermitis TaxID=1133319 RepID=UPI003A8B582B